MVNIFQTSTIFIEVQLIYNIVLASNVQQNDSCVCVCFVFHILFHYMLLKDFNIISCAMGFPGGLEVKASACNARDLGSIPGSGRCPGEGNGNPLQHSCLENSMDGGAWQATVRGVTKSQTQLSDFTFFLSFHKKE